MAEVTRPIISIMLVLCSVFVPVAFLGGIEGQFYRQFAITIAASTVISTLNSLTLSPALAALLLQTPARARRCVPTRHRSRARRLLSRLQSRYSRCCRNATATNVGIGDVSAGRCSRCSSCCCWAPGRCSASCRAASSLRRTNSTCSASCSCRTPPRSIAPKRSCARCRRSRCSTPGVAHAMGFPGLSANGFVSLDNAAMMFSAARSISTSARDENCRRTRSPNRSTRSSARSATPRSSSSPAARAGAGHDRRLQALRPGSRRARL